MDTEVFKIGDVLQVEIDARSSVVQPYILIIEYDPPDHIYNASIGWELDYLPANTPAGMVKYVTDLTGVKPHDTDYDAKHSFVWAVQDRKDGSFVPPFVSATRVDTNMALAMYLRELRGEND